MMHRSVELWKNPGEHRGQLDKLYGSWNFKIQELRAEKTVAPWGSFEKGK